MSTTHQRPSAGSGSTSSTPGSAPCAGSRIFPGGRGLPRSCCAPAASCTWSRRIRSAACLVISRDYFDDTPRLESCPYTYTDGDAELAHPTQVEFPHTMGEILTALTQAGLRLEFLREHDFDLFARFESLHRTKDGTWRFPPGRPRVPMLYSL